MQLTTSEVNRLACEGCDPQNTAKLYITVSTVHGPLGGYAACLCYAVNFDPRVASDAPSPISPDRFALALRTLKTSNAYLITRSAAISLAKSWQVKYLEDE